VSSAHDHSHGFDPGSAAPLFTNFPSGLQDPDAYTFTAGWEPASVGCQLGIVLRILSLVAKGPVKGMHVTVIGKYYMVDMVQWRCT